jgi:hypothetical protein
VTEGRAEIRLPVPKSPFFLMGGSAAEQPEFFVRVFLKLHVRVSRKWTCSGTPIFIPFDVVFETTQSDQSCGRVIREFEKQSRKYAAAMNFGKLMGWVGRIGSFPAAYSGLFFSQGRPLPAF